MLISISMANPVDLLHPELLSNDSLMEILSKRKVKLNELKNMNREKLLEVYQQYCLPHVQRKKKSNKLIPHSDNDKKCKETNINYTSKEILTEDKNINSSHLPKRIKLNNEGLCTNTRIEMKSLSISTNSKRKFETNDAHGEIDLKKQKTKITWP